MSKIKKYYIIGAGLSGLRIGQLLASAGNKVEIFEMDNMPGGLMRTEKRNGFLFDIGPHIFFRDYVTEYNRLIGDDLHNLKVLYGVGFNRRDIISPIRPLNLIRNLNMMQSIPLVLDVLHHKLGNSKKRNGHPNNAEEWVISAFGEEVYKYFFRDYIPKVMSLPAAMITEEWGTERHKFYKEHNLWQKSFKFLLDFLVNKQNKGGFLDVYYPENGAQQITEAIYQEILLSGGSVYKNTSVSGIEISNGKAVGLTINRNDREERVRVADSIVISTIPITNLFGMMKVNDTVIDDIKSASASLRYRNLWLFNFIIKRNRLKNKVQIYFPERKYIFKRIYEPKNLVRDPEDNGTTAICVEVCYNSGDEIESAGEKAVYSKVMEGLKDFYNISERDVYEMWSRKVPFAYSIYEIGYKDNLKKLAEHLFDVENLVSFGRQGSFSYNHMTNRVMDSCNTLYGFLSSGSSKKAFLKSSDPKSVFF